MSKHVTFKFSPLARIVDPFGNPGIVDTCAVNQTGGHIYLITTERDPSQYIWYAEDLIDFRPSTRKEGEEADEPFK